MKKLFKSVITCLAALAIVLGTVSVSASAAAGNGRGPKQSETDKSIVFEYVASPNQLTSASSTSSVKYTIEIKDGENVYLYTGDAGKNITENKEANVNAVFKKLFDEKDYKYEKCYFNWDGDNGTVKVEVKQFRNIERISTKHSDYNSTIGFKTVDDKKVEDFGKGPDADYYAYNPTGTLMVVFSKVEKPAAPAQPEKPGQIKPEAPAKTKNVNINYYVRLNGADTFVDATTESQYAGYSSSDYSASLGTYQVEISGNVFANEGAATDSSAVETYIKDTFGETKLLTLTDEQIRAQLSSLTFDANMIYSINWYVCKLDSNDGIHVDGKLVATQKPEENEEEVVINPVPQETPQGGNEDDDNNGGDEGDDNNGGNNGGDDVVIVIEEVVTEKKSTYVPVVLPPQNDDNNDDNDVIEEIIDIDNTIVPEADVEEEIEEEVADEPAEETVAIEETVVPEALPQTGTALPIAFYGFGSLLMGLGVALVIKKRN